jgi:hypothetical protein
MTIPLGCDDKQQLVAYVYGELPAEDREAVERHLALCAACAAEVAGFGEVRSALAGWQPPEAQLDFTVLPRATLVPMPVPAPAPPSVRPASGALPAWARFAAAVLVLGVGLGAANLQVRSDATGISVTTGWMTPASARPVLAAVPPAEPSAPALRPVEDATAWQPAMAALEARLRAEMKSTRVEVPSTDAAVLRKVEALIAESERRQRQEYAVRLAQLGRDVDMQRRADLVRLEQGVGQMTGRTGAEVARQRELLNYIVRTSMQRPQQ